LIAPLRLEYSNKKVLLVRMFLTTGNQDKNNPVLKRPGLFFCGMIYSE
jgi:hypothetical protein